MSWVGFLSTKRRVFSNARFSSLIAKVAVLGVAISVVIMLVSLSILNGYKNLIKDKMAGFMGHIHVKSMQSVKNYEYQPFVFHAKQIEYLNQLENVVSAYPIMQKAGIAKSDKGMEGLIYKGLFQRCDSVFYQKQLVAGRLPNRDNEGIVNEIVISTRQSKALNAVINDNLYIYFFDNEQVRAYAPTIVGIYNTGVEEYDKFYALVNSYDIKRYFNHTNKEQLATQIELKTNTFNKLEYINDQVNLSIADTMQSESIQTMQAQVFEWLNYLNKNIQIILVLMGLVAAINMITALLILMVDNTTTIGLLKALGAKNGSISWFYIRQSLQIVSLGLLIGIAIAWVLILIQKYGRVIKLPEENYYTSYVPVAYIPVETMWVALGTVLVCIVAMLIPAKYASRISPAQSVKFQ